MFSETDKLECVKRELKFRERVYPRLLQQHKMTSAQAVRELDLMRAIVEDYQVRAAKERLL
jgi:hypothetical protein